MTLKLFNSLGRKLEVFRPIVQGEVKMYTCGPTVWNYAHIGNFRTFTFEDTLRRYLIYKGYKVTQVKNLTDVEDRIIAGIKKTGKGLKELTSFYERAFMEDLSALGAKNAEEYPRATEHIPEMLALVKKLLELGYAYRTDDGSVYYSIRKFRRYGALSGVNVRDLKTGARVSSDHYEKEGANDFALWKAWDPDDGDVFWQTEFGKGRPGWHIECSAMAMRYLGESFDIHTGGKDLRFPHHENEIAQSEAATGKQFANYWLHAEFLNVEGEEMHKSLGNMVTLRELLDKGWNPRAIRLFLISAHYREPLNLTDESLKQAHANIRRMDDFVGRVRDGNFGARTRFGERASKRLLKDFESAMDDDLNVPLALARFFEFQRAVNSLIDEGSFSDSDRGHVLETMNKLNKVLAILSVDGGKEERPEIPEDVRVLVERREAARKDRNFALADSLREQIKSHGYEVQDTPAGPRPRKASTVSS